MLIIFPSLTYNLLKTFSQTVVRGEDGKMYDANGRLIHEGNASNGPNGIPPSAAGRMASSAVVRSNSLRSTSPPR